MSNLSATVLYNYTAQNSTELHVTANETLYIINRKEENGFSKVRNENGDEGLVPANIYKFKRSSNDSKDDNVPKNEKKENYEEDYNTSKVIGKNSGNNLQRANLLLEETVKYGTVRFKNKNIYGEIEIATNIEAKVEIIKDESNEISQWKPLGEFHKCQIESYGVDNKGITNFITYQLNSSYGEKNITRRFKDFEWFRSQLKDKFACIVIPPLPPRELMTNFRNELVVEGQRQLNLWLNYILDHPVITFNKFTKSFFEEDFPKITEKIKKPKGSFNNRDFYNNVDAPVIGIDWDNYSKRMNKMFYFIESFDKQSCGLQEGYNKFHKDHIEQISKIYEKFGNTINNFYITMSLNPDNDENDKKFVYGIDNISIVFGKIGALFKDQAKIDAKLIEDPLSEIINVTKEIPSIMDISKCIMKTITKINESKSDHAKEKEIDQQIQVIARTVDAEFNWLKNHRKQKLKSIMTQYLTNQINCFTQITSMLKDTLSQFEN